MVPASPNKRQVARLEFEPIFIPVDP
jgi:hypothetical protein